MQRVFESGYVGLGQGAVFLQERAQEHGQVLDEVLLLVTADRVTGPDVGAQGQHRLQLHHGLREQVHEHIRVVGDSHAGYFGQAFECDVAEERHRKEVKYQHVDKLGFEDVT